MTLLRLWLEYLEQQPADYRSSQFCRPYQRWARTLAMRQVHRAGEKVFVDFSGKKPSIIDAATGEIIWRARWLPRVSPTVRSSSSRSA